MPNPPGQSGMGGPMPMQQPRPMPQGMVQSPLTMPNRGNAPMQQQPGKPLGTAPKNKPGLGATAPNPARPVKPAQQKNLKQQLNQMAQRMR